MQYRQWTASQWNKSTVSHPCQKVMTTCNKIASICHSTYQWRLPLNWWQFIIINFSTIVAFKKSPTSSCVFRSVTNNHLYLTIQEHPQYNNNNLVGHILPKLGKRRRDNAPSRASSHSYPRNKTMFRLGYLGCRWDNHLCHKGNFLRCSQYSELSCECLFCVHYAQLI